MLGIFIEPEGKLKKFIIRWKYKIRKNYTNTNYVNHPTHSTIYTANLKNNTVVQTMNNFFFYTNILNFSLYRNNDLFKTITALLIATL